VLLTLFSDSRTYADRPGPGDIRKILMLGSWHPEMPWQVSFDKGLQDGLKSEIAHAKVFREYIDAGRFRVEDHQQALLIYLQQKYRS